MIHTKNYYLDVSSTLSRSQQPMFDLGYSLDIPSNDVYSTGWVYEKPSTWGKEHQLITRPDPEYFAPENIIRSNVLPSINLNDPVYQFDRSHFTYNLGSMK